MRWRLDKDTGRGIRPWLQDLAVSGAADLVRYQEASNKAVDKAGGVLRTWAAGHGRSLFDPANSQLAFSWDPAVFDLLPGEQGLFTGHPSAHSMGVLDVDGGPGHVLWLGLRHRASGQRCLFVNVHPIHGYEKAQPNDLAGNAWRDWAAGVYWLRVLSFTAQQLVRPADDGMRTRTRYWDTVELGGDMNGDLRDRSEWYYPANVLPSMYGPDRLDLGLDHLVLAHGSDSSIVHRGSVAANTDHRIHFATYSTGVRPDYPAERR